MSTTIFEEIRKDHEKQRTLLDLLTKTSGDSEGRREEEQEVFQQAGKILTENQKKDLARQMRGLRNAMEKDT